MSSDAKLRNIQKPVTSHFACRIDVFQKINGKCLGFYLIDQISEEMLLQYYPSMTSDIAYEITVKTINLFKPWIPIDLNNYLFQYIFEVSFSGRPQGYALQEWWESGKSPFL